ncbi:hypothetical protein PanWU01x14_066920 [Parasponia andersonii]|uniref:Uncharacterized protein n=1 Tax=Parasponia andersonii TaxID=3476 RepID=A0A2P5DGA0_PARAD|nr:hypothetical protein PanWU01x14_066920 [Parasponia andersonii]
MNPREGTGFEDPGDSGGEAKTTRKKKKKKMVNTGFMLATWVLEKGSTISGVNG